MRRLFGLLLASLVMLSGSAARAQDKAAEFPGGDRDHGRVEPADLVFDAEDRDLLAGRPAQDRIDRLRGIPPGMQNQPY